MRKVDFIAVFQHIAVVCKILLRAGRYTVEHRAIDERVPDTVFTHAVIASARFIAGCRPEIGKRCATIQRDSLNLRLISYGVYHLIVRVIRIRNPQMQIVRIGECNRYRIRSRSQSVGCGQEISRKRRVLLYLCIADIFRYGMCRCIIRRRFAGGFKCCPAFSRVLAAVFRHGILFGKCLNGTQIDLAFLNGIFANKTAVFQRICIIICGLFVCSNVYVLFGGAVGVEQGVKIALRRASRG